MKDLFVLIRVRTVCAWRQSRLALVPGLLLYAALAAGMVWFVAPLVRALVRANGASAFVLVLGSVHLLWLLASLGPGLSPPVLDLRPLRHLPVRPVSLVVADLALALTAPTGPPLLLVVAIAVAGMAAAGPWVVLAAAVAALFVVLVSAALGQLIARTLRRLSPGAVLVVFGAFAVMVFFVLRRLGSGFCAAPLDLGGLAAMLDGVAGLAIYVPTLSFPALLVAATAEGDVPRAALAVTGAVVISGLAIAALARAIAVALSGGRPSGQRIPAPRRRGVAGSSAGVLRTLVGRELQEIRRGNTVVALPLVVVPLGLLWGTLRWPAEHALVFNAVYSAAPMLVFSTNAFGFDREANRLLFQLPIPAGRLLLAKNLLCLAIAGAICLGVSLVGALSGRLGPSSLLWTIVVFVSVNGGFLCLGNLLSIYNPRPMVAETGGIPRAVAIWTVVQLAAAVALSGAFRELLRISREAPAIPVAVAFAAAGAWVASAALAGRMIDARTEKFLARLTART